MNPTSFQHDFYSDIKYPNAFVAIRFLSMLRHLPDGNAMKQGVQVVPMNYSTWTLVFIPT